MNVNPAIINQMKRIPDLALKSTYRRNEITQIIPAKPVLTVREYITKFQSYYNNRRPNELDVYRGDEKVDLDSQIQFGEQPYEFYDFELTEKTINQRYRQTDVDNINKLINEKNNFFEFLKSKYSKYSVPVSYIQSKSILPEIFNSEEIRNKIKERKENLDQWLFNKHTYSLITPYNIQKENSIFYKTFLTQILLSVVGLNDNRYTIDVDVELMGIETPTRKADFLIKNKSQDHDIVSQDIIIPVTSIYPFDEHEAYKKIRDEMYNYYMPYYYPLYLYEKVDVNKLSDSDIKKADYVNKKIKEEFRKKLLESFSSHFYKYSFRNINLLKILSRSRNSLNRRVQIGLSVQNDKFRFNVYNRPLHNTKENIYTLAYSPIYSLGITPGESSITNQADFATFLNIFNILANVDQYSLDDCYEEYIRKYKI